MPFYDFICSHCGTRFDKMLPMDRRNEAQVCPECGGTAERKAVSGFSCSSENAGGHGHGGGCGGT